MYANPSLIFKFAHRIATMLKRGCSQYKMGSADLKEASATRQQNSYTVSQRCAVFVLRHTNLCTKGICEAARPCFTACR
jgi:hypothetical protein